MATYQWIGASGGAWSTTTNWSPTSPVGGPAAGDTALANPNITGGYTIAVGATAIPALAAITVGDSAGFPNAFGLTYTGAGTWGIGAGTVPLTIAGTAGNLYANYADWQTPISGAGTIRKLGLGSVAFSASNVSVGAINIEQGGILFAGNNRLGTAPITMYDQTGLSNWNLTTAYTLANPITIHSTATQVEFNTNPPQSGNCTITLNGATFAIAAANPTIKVGANTAGGLVITGAITGTAGFTKAGAGQLTISNASSTLTGTVTLNTTGSYTSRTTLLGSGATTPLAGSGLTYHFISTGTGSFLEYTGNTSLSTVQSSFTSAAANCGFISVYTNAGVSFAPASTGGVSNYRGAWEVSQDNTVTAPLLVLNEFPTSASYLQYDTYGTTTATSTIRIIAASGGTTAATIQMGAGASGTHTYVVEDNSSAATVYSGAATKVAAQAGTLSLRGSNTSATISGNITVAAGTLAMNKQGVGKWILSGANTYTGTTTVSAGTLSAQSAGAFGTSGAVTQTGGTIDVSGGVALTKTGAAFTLISAAGANALTTTTGTNTLACAGITLSSTIIVDAAAGASLTVNNTAAMSGAFGITKNNSGEIGLGTFANTYTGAVTVAAGTLTVGNLQPSGTASSLGTGALSSAIALTGTLKYNGTGHSTNRSLTFTGAAPALDASGSGAVTYSAATQAAGARTITFTGSSTAANTLSAALSDGTGAVSVAKSGAGKWVLSNATLNYTGTTTISDGTLDVSGANRTLTGGVSISGGTLASTGTVAANTAMTGGTITAELTGNKTLDVNSGSPATLQPATNANTFSGATTVAAGGILRLITGANPTTAGAGRVLGTSAVSVSGDIKTSSTGAQRGQMRYGGNLTFNTGAKLYVGGA